MNGCIPSVTFFLMIEPKLGIERIKKNRLDKIDRMDKEEEQLHYKVYDGYKYLIQTDTTGRIIEIDASRTLEEVVNDVISKIESKIK
jgi:dTMP kinase